MFNKQIKFVNGLISIFSVYAENLDEYFKIEENKNNHKELYDYYQKLNLDLRNLKKEYKI